MMSGHGMMGMAGRGMGPGTMAGFGKLLSAEDIKARFDIGFGGESVRFYFKLGEAF